MTPQAFLAELAPLAMASAKATGIPAGFVLGQGALESGWGNSDLARLGCNLFGVKADAAWHGDTLSMETEEVINGERVMLEALWRKYACWADCVNDHAQFFLRNPRYAAALKLCGGPVSGVSVAFAHAIAQAGYATDPNYAAGIIAVIDSDNLTRYDLPQELEAPVA
jgi:flagellum-specific peptidoglycan hydrolase FlgJ